MCLSAIFFCKDLGKHLKKYSLTLRCLAFKARSDFRVIGCSLGALIKTSKHSRLPVSFAGLFGYYKVKKICRLRVLGGVNKCICHNQASFNACCSVQFSVNLPVATSFLESLEQGGRRSPRRQGVFLYVSGWPTLTSCCISTPKQQAVWFPSLRAPARIAQTLARLIFSTQYGTINRCRRRSES